MEIKFNAIEEAIEDIKQVKWLLLWMMKTGKQGDLVMAAEMVTPEAVNFNHMWVGLCLTAQRSDLDLHYGRS